MSSDRIRQELGYEEQVPLDTAFEHPLAWEHQHPPARVDPSRFDYAAEDAAWNRGYAAGV